MKNSKYCLDANVLIVAWHTYYAPTICLSYWDLLAKLGRDKMIFLPSEVLTELEKTDDDLLQWAKTSRIPVEKTDTSVISCLKDIYSKNPIHTKLIDSAKGRSLADPWVIAHAMRQNACVVTKENKIIASTSKVKIPNVCDNMGISWIDDFGFVKQVGIKFTCSI